MDLKTFPFDQQCLYYTIFSHPTEDLKLVLDGVGCSATQPSANCPRPLELNSFSIERVYVNQTKRYDLDLRIIVTRSSSAFISQYFLPSALLVVLFFASFWAPRSAVPARTALGLTNFLASCVILRGMSANLPQTNYLTILKIYVIVNMSFIMKVLLKFLLVTNEWNLDFIKEVSLKRLGN